MCVSFGDQTSHGGTLVVSGDVTSDTSKNNGHLPTADEPRVVKVTPSSEASIE